MKKVTLIALALLLLQALLYSQWQQIATIGNNELRSVKFFNEYTGIVAGQGGIWRSVSGGVNWTQVLTEFRMNALSFPDNNIGYAAGDSGKIYKSINGGINWTRIGIGLTTKKLYTVSFTSLTKGWFMGESGKILYTFNGGNSVVDLSHEIAYDIKYLQMINPNTGYFCGSSDAETFGFTPNGGINWLYSYYLAGNIFNSVGYMPTGIEAVFAVGTNGRIRKTTNNGINMSIVPCPVNATLNHIVFLNVNTGYISGNSGNILKTTNSGLNWVIDAVVTPSNLNYMSFLNETTGWIVGNNGVVIRKGIPVSVSQTGIEKPDYFKLEQNYPNPFNPVTKIKIELATSGFVKLVVYDALGNEIKTLVNGLLSTGEHEFAFNGENFSSGVYYCKAEMQEILKNRKFIELKKMILIK